MTGCQSQKLSSFPAKILKSLWVFHSKSILCIRKTRNGDRMCQIVMIDLCKIDRRTNSAPDLITIRTTYLHRQWPLPHLSNATKCREGKVANLAFIPSNKKQSYVKSQAVAAITPQRDSRPRKRSRAQKFSTNDIIWIFRALQRREHDVLQIKIITCPVWQYLMQLEAALATRRALRNAHMT